MENLVTRGPWLSGGEQQQGPFDTFTHRGVVDSCCDSMALLNIQSFDGTMEQLLVIDCAEKLVLVNLIPIVVTKVVAVGGVEEILRELFSRKIRALAKYFVFGPHHSRSKVRTTW
jgi:hypothetical protein